MTRRSHLAMLAAAVALGGGARRASAKSARWSSGTEGPSLRCHPMQRIVTTTSTTGAFLRRPARPCGRPTRTSTITGSYSSGWASRATSSYNRRRTGSTTGSSSKSVKAFGATARGIAMLDATVTPAELKRLHDAGIRGVRFGTRLPGGASMDDMLPVARNIAELGWHVQLVSEGDKIVELADVLKSMPVPVVFDHMGHLLEPAGPDHPAFRVIADLIEHHGAWVKLTGAYILSKIGPPTYADRSRLARAYVKLAPERLVWGSDWPHPTSPADAKPDDAVLLDLLADWAPAPKLQAQILVSNPAKLYGF